MRTRRPKGSQREPKGTPKGAQWHPKGSQGHPKGSQRDSKGDPKGPRYTKQLKNYVFSNVACPQNPGTAFFPEKKAPAAIPTARKMLKIRKKRIFCNLDMSPNPGTAFFQDKKKRLRQYPQREKCLTYTRTFGQIHKNIWTNTQEHLETYTKSFGNTPQTAPNEKVVFHGKVEFTL